MAAELGPRARTLLDAIEQEVAARERGLSTVVPPDPPLAPLRLDATLLAALELAVAGRSRAQIAHELHLPPDARLLDDVFGAGERLQRAG